MKSNTGHLEGSAGLAGVVKAVMVLEKGIIPPNALFESMNPDIDAEFYHVKVPTECIPWPEEGLRRVSVNSFGFGGSNSHVILDDAYHYLASRNINGNHCTIPSASASTQTENLKPATAPNGLNGVHPAVSIRGTTNGAMNGAITGNTYAVRSEDTNCVPDEAQDTFRLLVWTAADEGTLRTLIEAYETYLKTRKSPVPFELDKLSFTLAARRSFMLWRTFAVVDGKTASSVGTEAAQLLTAIPTRALTEPNVAFVFTGQGAQYVRMGLSLIQYPVFRDTLQQVDGIFRGLGSTWSIVGKNPSFGTTLAYRQIFN